MANINTALLAAADVMNYVFLRGCFDCKHESTIVHEGVLAFFAQMSEEDICYEPFKDACETEFEEGEYALDSLEETLETLRGYLFANYGNDFSEELFVYRFYKDIIERYFVKQNDDALVQITEPTRDELLEPFFSKNGYIGGCRSFEKLDKETLKTLIAKGFIDPGNNENGAPTTQEFLDFMEESKTEVTAHGYVVTYERQDVRMTLEGISAKLDSLSSEQLPDFIISFYDLCRGADTCEVDTISGTAYAWWS